MIQKRPNPDAGGTGARGVDDNGPWKPVDYPQASIPLVVTLQAERLRSRFQLSRALALATAELAFSTGRPR